MFVFVWIDGGVEKNGECMDLKKDLRKGFKEEFNSEGTYFLSE